MVRNKTITKWHQANTKQKFHLIGEKAVLTLADGTNIILDHAANGNLAQQGSAQVIKAASSGH